MKKEISISTCFNYDVPIERQFELVSQIGYKYISLSSNTSHSGLFDDIERLRHLSAKYHLLIDSIHGCRSDLDDSIENLTRFAYAAQKLSAKTVVLHPCQFYIGEDMIDDKLKKLLKVCDALKPAAKEYGVRFAIENLHPEAATEVLRRALPELDRDIFGLCYDSAHDQVDGPRDFGLLEAFGDRVIAVHISDRIKEFVDHVVPGEGFIDFGMICRLLNRFGYRRPILMEVMLTHTRFGDSLKLLEETYQAGCQIFDRVYAGRT